MSRPSDSLRREYQGRLLDKVAEYGWSCVNISSPQDEGLEFAYTVGFSETLNSPEFIVFGLNETLRTIVLGEVFRQIQAGKMPEDGQRWSNLIEGYDCVSRAVHPSNILQEHLNFAIWFWGDPADRGPLQAFQLVWPSYGSGLFPWEADCPQSVRDQQLPLYLPRRH